MRPFLKWAGGKRWLIPHLKMYLPTDYNNYFEPFLGGGAVYFFLMPLRAKISDINKDLINLYLVMRDKTGALKESLIVHQNNHSKDYYYYVRQKSFTDSVEKASQMLYLNRACYNGLYRVNKQGEFNVPIGTKSNFIYDLNMFDDYSRALKKADIFSKDFEEAIDFAKKGDLIFADPPYTMPKDSNRFINYNDNLFTWSDQLRLLNALIRAREKGVKILMTNINCYDIVELYTEANFNISFAHRSSTISGVGDKRKKVKELIISS